MSTPSTSSLLQSVETTIKNEVTKIESEIVYDVSTAFKHVKSEIESLETFIATKAKKVASNLESIESLVAENVTHNDAVKKATETVARLKNVLS